MEALRQVTGGEGGEAVARRGWAATRPGQALASCLPSLPAAAQGPPAGQVATQHAALPDLRGRTAW